MRGLVTGCLIIAAYSIVVAAHADDCATAEDLLHRGVKRSDATTEEASLYEQAISKCPGLAAAYYNLGINLLKRGQADKALEQFKEALSREETPLFLLGAGNAHLALNNLSAADESYQKALARESTNVSAMIGVAVVADRQGAYGKAEDILRQALQIESENSGVYYNLGIVLQHAGKVDDAIGSFKAAIERNPDAFDAELRLAELLTTKGSYEEAKQAFEAAQHLREADPKVFIARARLYEQQGELKRGIKVLKEGLGKAPDDRLLRANYGMMLVKAGQLDEGYSELQQLAKSFPDDPIVVRVWGWVLLQKRELEQAEQALSHAITLDGKDAFSYNNLAVVFELREEWQKAAEYFQRALSADAQLKEAQQGLARVQAHNNQKG